MDVSRCKETKVFRVIAEGKIKGKLLDNGYYIYYVLKICNPIVLHIFIYKKPSKARSFYIIYYIDIKFLFHAYKNISTYSIYFRFHINWRATPRVDNKLDYKCNSLTLALLLFYKLQNKYRLFKYNIRFFRFYFYTVFYLLSLFIFHILHP